jgi:cytoskeletal protein CcmA (bactofilin family)
VEAQGGVEVEGYLEAKVQAGGHVKIGAKAQWKGDCSAPSLEVELGGRIERGYFEIPEDPLGVGDME